MDGNSIGLLGVIISMESHLRAAKTCYTNYRPDLAWSYVESTTGFLEIFNDMLKGVEMMGTPAFEDLRPEVQKRLALIHGSVEAAEKALDRPYYGEFTLRELFVNPDNQGHYLDETCDQAVACRRGCSIEDVTHVT